MAAWLRQKPKLRPHMGGYYDLIRVPHGHIPVSKVFLWRRLPIPVREIRGDDYFKCPECGAPSFFNIDISCRRCAASVQDARPEDYWRVSDRLFKRWQRRDRHDYFRGLLKRLECLVLPLLVVTGQAWYVLSERHRWQRRWGT